MIQGGWAKRCFVALLGAFLSTAPIRAEELLTGVNLPNATRANASDRAAVIQQVKSAGVRIVRFPVGTGISDTVEYAAHQAVQSENFRHLQETITLLLFLVGTAKCALYTCQMPRHR